MELNSNMSEVDLAHEILKNSGRPLYYKDLIEKILAIKPLQGRDLGHIMAGVHTEINLDFRFVHLGKGVWGLREWAPAINSATSGEEDDLDEN